MFLTKSKKSQYYQITFVRNGKRTTVSTRTNDRKKAQYFLNNFSPTITNSQKEQKVNTKTPTNLKLFEKEYISFLTPTHSRSYINRSIKPAFKKLISIHGNTSLENITIRDFDKFISTCSTSSSSAASLYYRTLKAAFSKAVAWEYLPENPLKKIKSPKVSKSFPVFINDEQFHQIILKTNRIFLINIFAVAYYTGMRLGEILNLKWNWIDFETNIITVKNSDSFTTKSKKERIIPMNRKVKNILIALSKKDKHHPENDFVFSSIPGINYNGNFISKQFRKIVDEVKLNKQIHFHTLRHSFASNLVQKGTSLYVVKELLGHEDLKTTQIYSHLKQENLFDAVNLL